MKNSKQNFKITKVITVFCLFVMAFALIKTSTAYAANGLIDGLFEENVTNSETEATLNGISYALGEALSLAKSGETVYLSRATISSEVTVPKNVTLRVGAENGGSLFIENGGRLIVNGKLSLGGKEDIISPYLEGVPPMIICNGEIVVNGTMEAYLPAEGEGTVIVNGEVCEPIFIADYVKEVADDCYKRGNLPFNQYFLNTLKLTRVINYGGRYTGVLHSGKIFSPVKFIADDGLFSLESGKIVLSYDKSSCVTNVASLNMGNVGKTTVKISGSVISGISDFTIDKSYSTESTFLAIPYCMDIVVDGSFTVSEKTKLKVMPGSNFTVSENGTLNINGILSVYDGFYTGEAFGTTYPDYEILQKHGFGGCGNLIVNGKLNVRGGFYGTVQSSTESGVINISETASLSAAVTEGFSVADFANLSVFTLKAKVYGLNGFVSLEKGKTYKSACISPFSLKKFVMDKVVYGSLHTEYHDKAMELNQTLTGRFLEINYGNFISDVTFSIGENVKNVCVNLSGKNYYTDKEGKFTARIILNNFEVTYHTPDKDNMLRRAAVVYDGDTILDSVVKNVSLSEENDYVIKEDGQGRFFAIVNFYGGKTEKIEVFPKYDKTDDYVISAEFANENYPSVSKLKHDIYFYRQAFDDYKNAYNGLIDELSIKNSIRHVYETYIKLTENRTDKELLFLNSVLADYNDFSFVTDILPSVITYGDKTAQVIAVSVDGSKNFQTVTLSDYVYLSGDITVKAEYRGEYKGIFYTVEKTITNVQPKKVTYAIDDKSGIYLDEIKPLTGRCLSESSIDDGAITLFTTARQNSPVGNYSIMGKCESPFYSVTFANANYEILKKQISVKIPDKTVTLSESGNIRFDFEHDFGGVMGFKATNGVKSVIIDLSGNLSDNLEVGAYTVSAIFDENNFIGESNEAILTVLQDDNKYSVDFGFKSGDSKVYDGKEFIFTVTAVDRTDQNANPPTEISIQKDGALVPSVKDAGNYTVCVKIYDSRFFANFYVTPCPVNIATENTSVYYGDPLPEIEFTSNVPIDRVDIGFSVEGENIKAKSHNPNYIINSVTGSVKILPRPLTVSLDEKTKFYGDSDEALTCRIVSGSLPAWDSINKIMTLVREPGEMVGSYQITAERINENYQVTVIPSNYVILPREITVTANSLVAFYGEAFEVTASVTHGSLKAGDDLSDVVHVYRAEGTDVGVYPIQAELKNKNYNLTFIGSTVEIFPLNLIVTIPNVTAIYGDSTELIASALAEIPYGLTTKDIVKLEREEGVAVGEYKIHAASINGNFSVEFDFEYGDHSVLTIAKREIAITLSDVYAEFPDGFDEITQSVTYTITGGNLIEGDNLSLEFCAEKDGLKVNGLFGSPSAIGDYDLVVIGCNPNYSVKALPAKLYVTKKRVWLKNLITDFTYTGQPVAVFDISKNIGGLDGLEPKSFTVTIVDEIGNIVSLDNVINAGKYTVTVSADENLYSFSDNYNVFTVTVEKADISENIIVESEYGKFTVIGENRPIARLSEYNLKLVTEFYYGEEAVESPNKEGEYFVKVTVVDDNYKGEAVATFTACKDISPEIEKISKLLDEIKNDPSMTMINLLKIKETVSRFSDGEYVQIDKISAYGSVIDNYLKVYKDFYESEKQNFDTSNDLCFGVNPVDLALAAISLLLFAIFKKFGV